MSFASNDDNAMEWEFEKDPLEISDDFCIEEHEIDPKIKQEINDIDIYSILPKIVDVKDLLKDSAAVNNFKINSSHGAQPCKNTKLSVAKKNIAKRVLKKNSHVNKKKNFKNFSISKSDFQVSISTSEAESSESVSSTENQSNSSLTDIFEKNSNEKPTIFVKNIDTLMENTSVNTSDTDSVPSTSLNTVTVPTVPAPSVPAQPSFMNQILIPIGNDKSKCNCMRYIEIFCSKCNESSFYRKDLTQCLKCQTLLKLQCKKCSKRYSYLNSVHQYLFQLTKRENLLNENKAIKFTKKVCYLCSKCNINFDSKDQLEKHIQSQHPVSSNKDVVKKHPTKTVPSNDSRVSKKNDHNIKLHCIKCNITLSRDFSTQRYKKKICQNCQIIMVFYCSLCQKTYTTMRNARKHVVKCLKELGKFSCQSCNFKTPIKSLFVAHFDAYHKAVTCACSKTFNNSNELAHHKISGSCSKSQFQNPQPALEKKSIETNKKTTVTEDEDVQILEDKEVVHNSENLPIFKDNFIIINRDPATLLQEITGSEIKDSGAINWNEEVDYYCTFCKNHSKKQFIAKQSSCKTCKRKYYFRCTKCSETFSHPKSIFLHVKKFCTKQDKLQCTLCLFETTRKYFLFDHIKACHTVYKCLKCQGDFKGFQLLSKHQCTDFKTVSFRPRKNVEKCISLFCIQCNSNVSKTLQKPSKNPICLKCRASAHYHCLRCKNYFKDYDTIFKHIQCLCKPKQLCNKCNFKAYDLKEILEHKKTKHPEP